MNILFVTDKNQNLEIQAHNTKISTFESCVKNQYSSKKNEMS